MNLLFRRIGFAAAAGVLVAAVFKEFAQPKGLRVGAGHIFGIPYNLRLPHLNDVQQRYWNAEGSLLAPPLFGVGVVPNLPALARKLGLI